MNKEKIEAKYGEQKTMDMTGFSKYCKYCGEKAVMRVECNKTGAVFDLCFVCKQSVPVKPPS